MVEYLKRVGQSFVFNSDGRNITELYYSGTHQIVLSGDCVNPALETIELLSDIYFFVYDDEDHYRCYIVAPYLTTDKSFFEQVVKPVEAAVEYITKDDGSYSIRPKIPTTPSLPTGPDDAQTEIVSGIPCYKAIVHLGRGYGNYWSEVTILMSKEGHKIFYRVQRYLNKVGGAITDGPAKLFAGAGAQWQAICFAYGISPSEAETKEAAHRAKKFVYAIVGELMERFWSNQTQPSFWGEWRSMAAATAIA